MLTPAISGALTSTMGARRMVAVLWWNQRIRGAGTGARPGFDDRGGGQKKYRNVVETRFLRAPEALEPGEHACLVYDDDARRDSALLTFLGHGLDRGERVVYLARTPDDPLAAELSNRARDGQFEVVASEDCYLREGMFDPDRVLAGFRAVLDDAAARGFAIVRTAGGPPPGMTANGASRELPAYERRAGSLFAGGRLVSICTYDARIIPPVSLLRILDAHPIVLYALADDGLIDVGGAGGSSLTPSGWLDLTTLGSLTGPLARAVASGEDVSVDLERVEFVDVSCLRLFVEAARELAARRRRLVLVRAREPVPGMLRLLGFDKQEGLVLQ
jgi:anti-anti-sigma factor